MLHHTVKVLRLMHVILFLIRMINRIWIQSPDPYVQFLSSYQRIIQLIFTCQTWSQFTTLENLIQITRKLSDYTFTFLIVWTIFSPVITFIKSCRHKVHHTYYFGCDKETSYLLFNINTLWSSSLLFFSFFLRNNPLSLLVEGMLLGSIS